MQEQNPFDSLIPAEQDTQANPFSELIPEPNTEPGSEKKEEDSSAVASFGKSAVEGVRQAGIGLQQAATPHMEDPSRATMQKHGLPSAVGSAQEHQAGLHQELKQSKDVLAQERERHPIASRLGEVLGTVAPYVGVPGGVLGSVMTRVGTGAMAGAGIGAIQPREEGESRTGNIVAGGLLGAALPATIGSVKGITSLIRGKEKALQKTAAGLKQADMLDVKKTLKAADELDVAVTPGEASGSTILKAREGRMPVNVKTQQKVDTVLGERGKTLTKHTRKLIDDVVPEGDEAAAKTANDLYEKISTKKLSSTAMKEVMDDPVLAKNLERATANADFNINQYKSGTVGQMNELKKFIQYREGLSKTQAGMKNKSLADARKKLVSILDNTAPEYAKARQTSQRIIMKRDLLDKLDNVKLKPGQDEPVSEQLYSTIFGSKKQQQQIIDTVKTSGGDVKQAKNLIRVLNRIDKSSMHKLINQSTKLDAARFGGSPAARGFEWTERFLMKYHYKAILDLALDPKWSTKVEKLWQSKNPQADLLEFMASQYMLKKQVPEGLRD